MIEVLPPNIANQIAAGEVVQRPSSIVKELMENAVDAGAKKVIVRCVDGGRTLIGVIDDGVGISREDTPRAFLRHATSKIRKAEDLFNLHSFGFRGEALASIASVSEVEMRTRRAQDELGTLLEISAGEVSACQDCEMAARGTSIMVRNLFYNIPARRKFLKSDRSEAAAVYAEFVRVAMVNPDTEFAFHSNLSDKSLTVTASGLHERIVALTKTTFRKKLLSVDLDTELVRLSGYVGTPDMATVKSGSSQFLFVNGRFVRSPFLQRAVIQAFDRLIATGSYPSYFLFLEVAPQSIDVNISPTKTEVKFDDEQSVFQTIQAAVKACLGRANVVQAIDFNAEAPLVDIPTYAPSAERPYSMPVAHSGKPYNPFKSYSVDEWEKETANNNIDPQKIPFMEVLPTTSSAKPTNTFSATTKWEGFQFGGKYIALRTVEGLSIVNIARARQRIQYDKIMGLSGAPVAQYLISPIELDLTYAQRQLLLENIEPIEQAGFVLSIDEPTNMWELHALPSGLDISAFDTMLSSIEEGGQGGVVERLARGAVRGLANEKPSRIEDISAFIDLLMECDEPSFSPFGLPVIEVVSIEELDKRMK